LFVVPTITFRMLFGFVVLHHGRRQLVHVGVTGHPTAEWWQAKATGSGFISSMTNVPDGRVSPLG